MSKYSVLKNLDYTKHEYISSEKNATNQHHLLDLYIPAKISCHGTHSYRDLTTVGSQLQCYVTKQEESCYHGDCQSPGVPLVVFIHGGGWRRGYKQAWEHYLSSYDTNLLVWLVLWLIRVYDNVGETYAKNGIACAVMAYPLCKPSVCVKLLELCISFVASNLLIALVLFLVLGIGQTLVPGFLIKNRWIKPLPFYDFIQLTVLCTQFISLACMIVVRTRYQISKSKLLFIILISSVLILDYLMNGNIMYNVILFTITIQATHLYLKYITMESNVSYHQQLESVTECVDWLRTFAQRTSLIDDTKLVLMGYSAGAHLISLVTIQAKLRPIKGVIGLSGVYDVLDLASSSILRHLYIYPAFGSDPVIWRQASPLQCLQTINVSDCNITHYDSEDQQEADIGKGGDQSTATDHNVCNFSPLPPFLLITGSWDKLLLPQAKAFHQTLRNLGVHVRSIEVPHTDHFGIVRKFSDNCTVKNDMTKAMIDFVRIQTTTNPSV